MILAPVDFTASSEKGLDCALSLAKRLDASIVLLHVVDKIYGEGFADTAKKSDNPFRITGIRATNKLEEGLWNQTSLSQPPQSGWSS